MRTMMKKCGVYVTFAVVLLAMAVLVTGCSTGGGDYQPPAGLGAVKLNLANTTRAARSIVPGTLITDFTKFNVTFTSVGSGGVSDSSNTNIALANVKGPYNLAPGKYNILVVGFTADGDVAAGSENGVNVVANTITTVPLITLISYDPADATTGDEGTFAWKINNHVTGTLTSADIIFTQIPTSGTEPAPFDLLGTDGWINSIDLLPGYYYVDFVLVKSGIATPLTLRHILHIYKNQTSTFEYDFSDLYFTWAKVEFGDVDFDAIVDPQPELDIYHGTSDEDTVAAGGTISVYFDSVGGTRPTSIPITVTNAIDYATGGIKWYLNSTTALTTGLSGGNGEVLTVNTASAPFNKQGTYHLTVVGSTNAAKSVPASTVIYITILP